VVRAVNVDELGVDPEEPEVLGIEIGNYVHSVVNIVRLGYCCFSAHSRPELSFVLFLLDVRKLPARTPTLVLLLSAT